MCYIDSFSELSHWSSFDWNHFNINIYLRFLPASIIGYLEISRGTLNSFLISCKGYKWFKPNCNSTVINSNMYMQMQRIEDTSLILTMKGTNQGLITMITGASENAIMIRILIKENTSVRIVEG